MMPFEQRTQKRRRRKRASSWPLLVAGLLVIAIVGGVVWGYSLLKGLKEEGVALKDFPKVKPGERINILFLGVDNGTTASGELTNVRSVSYTRTDTMILVSVDPDTRDVGLLWIPRDSRVEIPGRPSYEKVAHAHAHGGPTLAMATVSQMLGVDVHYYVKTDFEGFARLVDLLGGVPMHVESDMYYADPCQGLVIDIKAGDHTFFGAKALEFVRYREYLRGDIDRVKAQQQFARAVLQKVFSVSTLPRIPGLVRDASNWVDTNMEPSRMLSLANLARQIDENDIQIEMLPGADAEIVEHDVKVSYWVVDQEAARRSVELLIKGIDRNVNASISVQVLDGANKPSSAEAMAKMLAEAGFTVVDVGEAPNTGYVTTEVQAHEDDMTAADGVGRTVALSTPTALLVSVTEHDPHALVTVIIGEDCTLK